MDGQTDRARQLPGAGWRVSVRSRGPEGLRPRLQHLVHRSGPGPAPAPPPGRSGGQEKAGGGDPGTPGRVQCRPQTLQCKWGGAGRWGPGMKPAGPPELEEQQMGGRLASGSPVWSLPPQRQEEGGPGTTRAVARPGCAAGPPGGSGAAVSVQARGSGAWRPSLRPAAGDSSWGAGTNHFWRNQEISSQKQTSLVSTLAPTRLPPLCCSCPSWGGRGPPRGAPHGAPCAPRAGPRGPLAAGGTRCPRADAEWASAGARVEPTSALPHSPPPPGKGHPSPRPAPRPLSPDSLLPRLGRGPPPQPLRSAPHQAGPRGPGHRRPSALQSCLRPGCLHPVARGSSHGADPARTGSRPRARLPRVPAAVGNGHCPLASGRPPPCCPFPTPGPPVPAARGPRQAPAGSCAPPCVCVCGRRPPARRLCARAAGDTPVRDVVSSLRPGADPLSVPSTWPGGAPCT